MRHENSPGLFGDGVGSGTYGQVLCELCGTIWNKGCDEDNLSDTSISISHFAGKQICDCCFEIIEKAVLNRMDVILPWYKRILAKRRKSLESDEKEIATIEAGQALKGEKL